MKRIAILGAGGAGKSWLARELGQGLNIPPTHLDALYYDDQWRPTPADQWAALQRRLVGADRWIIDGNYQSTAEIRLARADTIVFLDTPTARCLARIFVRRARRSGPARPAVLGSERITWEFLLYVAAFRRSRRAQILAQVAAHASHATIAVLRGPADIDAFLCRVGPAAGDADRPVSAVRRADIATGNRRRPTLPGPFGPSTIGAEELNGSVRNGKRCFPLAITTGNLGRPLFAGPENYTVPMLGYRLSVKPSTH